MSSRPTGYTRTPQSATSSATVGRPLSSESVVTYPRGLLSIRQRRSAGAASARPSRRTSSRSQSARSPSEAVFPFTVIRPAWISSSAFRREQTPAAERIFCRRSIARPFSAALLCAGQVCITFQPSEKPDGTLLPKRSREMRSDYPPLRNIRVHQPASSEDASRRAAGATATRSTAATSSPSR